MAGLTGKTVATTYHSLLKVSSTDNQNFDTTLRDIVDGEDTASCLKLATDKATVTLGTDAGDDFVVTGSSASNALVIEGESGQVGIGCTDPADKLEISEDGGSPRIYISNYDNTEALSGGLFFQKSDGSRASQTALDAEAVIGVIAAMGHDGGDLLTTGAKIEFKVADGVTPGSSQVPTNINLYTSHAAGDSIAQKMTILHDGNVGIGSASPISQLEVRSPDDSTGGIVSITNANPNVGNNDVLGRINFSAPLEHTTDGNEVAASIAAIAQDTFAADNNSTALHFQTGKSEIATTKMVIDEDGKVGIGTNAPGSIFAVSAGNSPPAGSNSIVTINCGDDSNYDSGLAMLHIHNSGNRGAIGHANGSHLLRCDYSDATAFIIDEDGAVGIGTDDPGSDASADIFLEIKKASGIAGLGLKGGADSRWELTSDTGDDLIISRNGTARFKIDGATGDSYTNDSTLSSLSDVRIKKDITDLTDGLNIVNQLKPRTYKFNGKAAMAIDDDVIRYGFVADEVMEATSHYTSIGAGMIDGSEVNDLKSLSMTRMIPMLVKAIQELSAKVTALENA